MKSVRVSITLSLIGLLFFAPGPSTNAQYPRWLHGATGFARAIELQRELMNATRQTRNSQLVEVKDGIPTSRVESKIDPLPAIDAVLSKYVNAAGGREAQEKIKSRVIRGRVEFSGSTSWGQLTIYGKAPNKSLTVMNVEPMGQVKRGYDGHTAWNAGDTAGLQILKDTSLVGFSTEGDFYRELKLAELYPAIRVMGIVKEKDREWFLVEGYPRVGGMEYLFFETKSGLLTGRDITEQTAQGPIRMEMRYSDFRDVDGVKLPFKIVQFWPQLKLTFTVTEIKHNVPLDNNLFEKP